MRESAASKVVLGEIQKREGALKAEVEKRENALLAADQQLAQQRGALSAEEFAQKRSEISQQAAEVRKSAQAPQAARKSVVSGKSVSGRVEYGGRRIIKKKK